MSNCNCEPKTYNIGMGCCQPVLGDIRNYYTKYQIDRMIESATTSGCCITPEEVDDKIASAKTDIESEIPSLDGYATTAYVNTQISSQTGDFVTGEQLSSYTYSKAVIDSKIASGGTFDPSLYYNKTETDNLLDNKLDVSAYTPTDLSDYYTKSETNNQISSATADMATKTWVGQQGYLTEHQSLSGYATQQWVSGYTYDKQTIDDKVAQGGSFDPTQYYNKTEVDNKIASAKTEIEGEIPSLNGYATQQWVEDKHYITGVDLSNYATKSEIPTVPTNVSAFNNDAGYLTEHQSLSAYSTTNEVNNLINQSVSGKASQSDLETVSGDVNTLSSDAVTGVRITTVSAQKEAHIEQARLSGGYSNAGIIYTVGSGLTFDATNKKIAVDSSVIAQKSDLDSYSTTSEVNNLINQSVSGKVDTTKYNTYTASTQTTINSKADSSTLNNYLLKSKIWCGTQSQYNSITNKDSETLYLIHE